MNLRKEARGRECQVRLEGICNGDPATTVLAHYRLSGISGMGMKSPDLFGAWCCSDCHAVCDGQQRSNIPRDARLLALAEGVFRTQAILIAEGKL